MSESRISSSSSSDCSSSSSTTAPRTLKRRLPSTPDLTFFTPAAESFQPLPYIADKYNPKSVPPPSVTTLAIPAPVMDPSPSDPYALFIHPPFESFPNAHLHPEGLSYALLAMNPEWFLDAADFITVNNSDPSAIPYPQQLEPPRGWCPTKKKDLKDRGLEGWPEGEEPRLRCTFCRRTYAGVNAKSMWRRHVFEKHKIAMSNRRDSHDRIRGRGSNKNKQQASVCVGKENSDFRGRIVDMDVIVPESLGSSTRTPSHRRIRSLLPADGACAKAALAARVERSREKLSFPSAPVIPQNEFAGAADHFTAIGEPRTVHSVLYDGRSRRDSRTYLSPDSPSHPQIALPATSYDPLATPAYHNSPPRLPADQPWRFASPSHPLHARALELSLSMIAQDSGSPTLEGLLLSPDILTIDDSHLKSPTSQATHYEPTEMHHPSADVEEPLAGQTASRKRLSLESSSDAWLCDSPLTSSPDLLHSGLLMDPLCLDHEHSFGESYFAWHDDYSGPSAMSESPASTPEVESPVLRSTTLPSFEHIVSKCGIVGVGLGLVEPLTPTVDDEDLVRGLRYSVDEDNDADSDGGLALVFKDTSYAYGASPMRKRRRVVNSHN